MESQIILGGIDDTIVSKMMEDVESSFKLKTLSNRGISARVAVELGNLAVELVLLSEENYENVTKKVTDSRIICIKNSHFEEDLYNNLSGVYTGVKKYTDDTQTLVSTSVDLIPDEEILSQDILDGDDEVKVEVLPSEKIVNYNTDIVKNISVLGANSHVYEELIQNLTNQVQECSDIYKNFVPMSRYIKLKDSITSLNNIIAPLRGDVQKLKVRINEQEREEGELRSLIRLLETDLEECRSELSISKGISTEVRKEISKFKVEDIGFNDRITLYIPSSSMGVSDFYEYYFDKNNHDLLLELTNEGISDMYINYTEVIRATKWLEGNLAFQDALSKNEDNVLVVTNILHNLSITNFFDLDWNKMLKDLYNYVSINDISINIFMGTLSTFNLRELSFNLRKYINVKVFIPSNDLALRSTQLALRGTDYDLVCPKRLQDVIVDGTITEIY